MHSIFSKQTLLNQTNLASSSKPISTTSNSSRTSTSTSPLLTSPKDRWWVHTSTQKPQRSLVLDGEGYFEMACPHLAASAESRHSGSSSQQRQKKSSPGYQRITGDLRRGTVFVAPAGHPVTSIASRNSNLQMVCFEIDARDNIRFPLTGKKNVVSQFDQEANELAFNAPTREVERIFNKQNEEFFFEGPNETPCGFDHKYVY